MADGWKQLLEDVGRALGIQIADHPSSSEAAQPQSAVSEAPEDSLEKNEEQADLEVESRDVPSAEGEPPESEKTPAYPGQKLLAFGGVLVTLVLAVAFFSDVYFGGPKPPAPDVVATFNGGQITVEQVQEHLAVLLPDHDTALLQLGYEDYRSVIEHMILDEMVRQWAAEQKLDASTRFKDAMRHISESATLDEWVTSLHQKELLATVSESDIQAFYESNPEMFANATLGEVRDQIRETLAHENQQKFFDEYLVSLRAEATITTEYELLEVPEPTNEQVQKFYNDNPDQFILPRRALVDRIFVPFAGAGEEADAQARDRASEARAALQSGKEFSEVASNYSDEPFSPSGVIIEDGKDDPKLAEQAFALSQEGDLSPLIQTQDGYYVLKLREQQPSRQLSIEEARPYIVATIKAENESVWFEQNADRTLFTIHGERFTLGQFYHEYQNLPPEMQAQFSGLDGLKELADMLIDRMLVLDDAYNKLIDQEDPLMLEVARTAVLREMIHEAEVDSKVKVTEEDIRNYYEKQKDNFATPPEARVQSMRIFLGETEDEYKRAWARADEAYGKLVEGANFDEVAKEYDESDRSTAEGALGEWIRMGDDPTLDLLAHPLYEYIFSLAVGEVSQPFEYGQDIYLVKVLELTEPKPLDFEQVKDYIRSELEARQHAEFDTELALRLLDEAHVTIYDQVIQQMMEARQTTSAP